PSIPSDRKTDVKVPHMGCLENMDVESNAAYPTPFANSPLLPLLLLSLVRERHAPKYVTSFNEEYDFVIVGAGTAGSVLASRLTEVPCVKVLLLEAGKSPPLLNEVPALATDFWSTDLDWRYQTVSQKNLGGKTLKWPSGKGVGGSSLLNGGVYVRGNPKDYDEWAKRGAVGWSYSDLFPYFLKMEDNREMKYLENGYHVVGGPITVNSPNYVPELKKPLLETAKLLGYNVVDSNGRSQTGYFDYQVSQRNGQRCSVAKAYLVPAENRTNLLHILPNSFVRKVLIQDKIVRGVEFDYNGSTYRVKVKREAILSAGTVNTAQLLMLSGIGPKEHLEKLKIAVAADLPVGDNFHDHIGVPVPFTMKPDYLTIDVRAENETVMKEYIYNRTGYYTSAVGDALLAFLNGPKSVEPDFPDYQLTFTEINTIQKNISFETIKQTNASTDNLNPNLPIYQCVAQILHPKSRGTVRLQSNSPYDPPLIDPNYLQDATDLEGLVNAMDLCYKIGSSDPMVKAVGSKLVLDLRKGCEPNSKETCLAKAIAIAMSHPVGTVAMGNAKDPKTVVDPLLRVKGITGLRVVDASIMPVITSGNTYIPTVMIGEKASDIIKSTIECDTQYPVERS
ncbi:hypothetical protein JTE90_012771, partial [Oedothorax gibbosus]